MSETTEAFARVKIDAMSAASGNASAPCATGSPTCPGEPRLAKPKRPSGACRPKRDALDAEREALR